MSPKFAKLVTLAVLVTAAPAALADTPPVIIDAQLGLGGQYKLGRWAPLRVQVQGGTAPLAVTVVAIAPDADGIGVATTPPGGRPLSTEPGLVSEALLYTRPGKDEAPIEVRLMAGGKQVDRRLVAVGDPDATDRIEIGPATLADSHLVAEIGGDAGVAAWADRGDEVMAPDIAIRLAGVDDLPRDALGYDGFDAVVLTVGRTGWLSGVAADDPRLAALERWVRSGGRLVLSCGAAGADYLTPAGPLARLIPGRFDALSQLPRGAAIERYAEATDDQSIDLEGGELQVSRLTQTTGVIEAFDGREASQLPLVIRSPLGFGEVVFVAFDLNHQAIAGWPGRKALVSRLLGPRFERPSNDAENFAYYNGGADYVSTLVRLLDNAFTSVSNTPFIAVVGLVLGYLVLIGPGDYFFVKRVLRRVEATWVTFPLIVLLTSAGAYAAAFWLKGDALLVNQVEVLDVDTAEGRVRGTLVTHLFSPRADRYDLRLATRAPDGEAIVADGQRTAWLGKHDFSLGGTRGSAASRLGWRPDYVLDPTPQLTAADGPSVRGMPIQVWSTKTLMSVWSAPLERSVESALVRTDDGLVEGRLTNDAGAALSDCRLLFGDWAWRLGELGDGETATVDRSVAPVRVNTLLYGPGREEVEDNYGWFSGRLEDLMPRLAVEGRQRTTAKSRRPMADLARCDLAHHLATGRALLLARGAERGSEMLRDGEPLTDDEANRRGWVFLRFILEVGGDG